MTALLTPKKSEKPKPPYEMPIIVPGSRVLWFPEEGCGASVALVTQVCPDMVDLYYFASGATLPIQKTGVRHRYDPMLATLEANQAGVGFWDFVPGAVNDAELHAHVNAITARLARAEERLADLTRQFLARIENAEKRIDKLEKSVKDKPAPQ